MIQDVSDLAGRQPGIEGHEDSADAHRTELRIKHRRNVWCQDRDSVAAANPAGSQRRAEPMDPLAELGVGVDSLAMDDGWLIRVDQDTAFQEGERRERGVVDGRIHGAVQAYTTGRPQCQIGASCVPVRTVTPTEQRSRRSG